MAKTNSSYAPDDTSVYSTQGHAYIRGQAIAIDLRDAGVDDCQVSDLHAVIFFRRKKRWTPEELKQVNARRETYFAENNLNKILFTVQGWGPNSKLIIGPEFQDYAQFLMNTFKDWRQDRPLHITLCHRHKGGQGTRIV